MGINGTTYSATTAPPTGAGQSEASASYAGDVNHTGSGGQADFTIDQAGSTTTVAWADGTSTTYDGNPHGCHRRAGRAPAPTAAAAR